MAAVLIARGFQLLAWAPIVCDRDGAILRVNLALAVKGLAWVDDGAAGDELVIKPEARDGGDLGGRFGVHSQSVRETGRKHTGSVGAYGLSRMLTCTGTVLRFPQSETQTEVYKMATKSVRDTWQCPLCRVWVELPRVRQQAFREKHRNVCGSFYEGDIKRAETVEKATSSDMFFACGLCGADITAEPFHQCAAPACDCGRGPIQQGNMTPDCCVDCGESMSVAPGRACRSESTVKRATLWNGIVDTFATEGELNGWRPTQGQLFA